MIFFLLALLLALLLFMHKLCKSLLHPITIVLGMFCVSITLCAANFREWGDISGVTSGVLILGIMSFVFGGLSGRRKVVVRRHNTLKSNSENLNEISAFKTGLVCIFMGVVTVLEYHEILSISGGVSGIAAVAAARQYLYINSTSFTHTAFVLHGLYISRMLGLIYVFDLWYSPIIRHSKVNIISIVPVALYAVQTVLSTGRTEMLYFVYGIVVIGYILYMSSIKWQYRGEQKFLKYIYVAIVVAIALFVVMGNMRSSNVGKRSAFDMLSGYGGSSISALDQYIAKYGTHSISNFWGEETQPLLYSILKALNISEHSSVAVMRPITLRNYTTTNIYTAFRRYIHDYGLIGLVAISCIVGYLYSYAFNRIKNTNNTSLRVIVYAFLSYPLVEISIEERVLSTLVTARTLFCLIYVYIAYCILYSKKILKRRW